MPDPQPAVRHDKRPDTAQAAAAAAAPAHAPTALLARAWDLLESVTDPEIPVVNLRELGIVRSVELRAEGPPARLAVALTPTYSGCPATALIEAEVRQVLQAAGFEVEIERRLAPAWTSDWISDSGRAKLAAYGIAPPVRGAAAATAVVPLAALGGRRGGAAADAIACPRCASAQTERLAEFGSTACKALYRCRACGEPFDYFKPY